MRGAYYFLLIVITSAIPFIAILLNPLLPHTHDGFVHLARIGAYFKALADFQIPVRWAGDLNYGYGMPLFNFIYHVPYIISSFFVSLGLGLVNSFKLTLALSFILSGIFMLGFARAFFQDAKKAVLVTLFYQFAPFRFIEILIRGSFGEVYAYAFFPLVLWGIVLLFRTVTYRNILITSFGTALLVLSHNAISLIFFIACIGFVVFFGKSLKSKISAFLSLFLGLCFASFYWIPAIFEHHYTYGDLFMKDLYKSHFAPLQNFFIPNFFNDVNLQTGGISVSLGIFHVIFFVLAFFTLIVYKKTNRKLFVFCIIIFFAILFLMQPISKPIWERVSLLRQFQFPWRLLAVSVFVTSLTSVSFFSYGFFKKNIIYFTLIFLLVLSTVYYWRPLLGWDKIDEKYYWNFPLNTTYYGETDLIWSKGPADKYPKNRIDIIDGKGNIEKINKKSNLLTFSINAQTPIKVVSHIQYFPGWRVWVDQKQVPIEFQYQIYRGEIVFSIPKGQHEIKLSFGESKLRIFSDILSIGALLAFAGYGLFRKLKTRL